VLAKEQAQGWKVTNDRYLSQATLPMEILFELVFDLIALGPRSRLRWRDCVDFPKDGQKSLQSGAIGKKRVSVALSKSLILLHSALTDVRQA
jgi:hypothetical protein